VKAGDLPAVPAKFDRLTMGAEVFVVEAAHQVHLNGAVIGYRLLSKGR
jgi:hypothetical protein